MHSLKISDGNAVAYCGTELSENIAPDFCLLNKGIVRNKDKRDEEIQKFLPP